MDYYICQVIIIINLIKLDTSLPSKVLSVIIPLYNEEKSIVKILDKVISTKLPYNTGREIIIVNDASTDDSKKVIEEYIKYNKEVQIKLVSHDKNSGKGAAVKSGINKISGDYVIIQDADLEYDPDDYYSLLKCMIDKKLKVIYGSRFLNKENRHSYQTFYWGGRLVSLITNILYNQNLTDEPTCYKMFDTALLKSIKLNCNGFEFCPEVTSKVSRLGYKIKELPINYTPRSIEQGKKIRWTDGLEAITVLIKNRFISYKHIKK